MKKLTKAAIAAAAGTALLLGAGGTLASWNASVTAGSATITAGDLAFVETAPTGTWQVKKNAAATAVAIADISTFRAVPGDILIYTSTATVRARGDNLGFTVGLTPGSITGATAGAADTALAATLASAVTYAVSSTAPGVTVTNNSFTISNVGAAEKTYPVTVTATITWPFGTSGSDNANKTGAVNLSQFAILVDQVAAS